jgi:hypothetical protein
MKQACYFILKTKSMKQSESNFLSMVQAVLANLKKDQSFWIGEPKNITAQPHSSHLSAS